MLMCLRLVALSTLLVLLVLQDLQTVFEGLLVGWFVFWVLGSIVTHKCFTHNAFEMKSWLKPIMLYLPNLLLFGSVLAWSSVHVHHHKYSDKSKDPHSPKEYSALASFFVSFKEPTSMLSKRDLLRNKWAIFFHTHYDLSVLLGIGAIACCGTQALTFYFLIVIYAQIAMFFSSYVYHSAIPFLHYRNYSTPDESYNSFIAAILFPSEGYHNNHHKFPNRVSNAIKWYEFDFSNVIVKFLEK